MYIPRCVSILRRKVREGLSLWFPAVCILIFMLTMTVWASITSCPPCHSVNHSLGPCGGDDTHLSSIRSTQGQTSGP